MPSLYSVQLQLAFPVRQNHTHCSKWNTYKHALLWCCQRYPANPWFKQISEHSLKTDSPSMTKNVWDWCRVAPTFSNWIQSKAQGPLRMIKLCHKQMHIFKLFIKSKVNPFSSKIHKINPYTNIKTKNKKQKNIHTQAPNTHFGRVSPFNIALVKKQNITW